MAKSKKQAEQRPLIGETPEPIPEATANKEAPAVETPEADEEEKTLSLPANLKEKLNDYAEAQREEASARVRLEKAENELRKANERVASLRFYLAPLLEILNPTSAAPVNAKAVREDDGENPGKVKRTRRSAEELEAVDAEIVRFLQANAGQHGKAAIEAGTGCTGIGPMLKTLHAEGKISKDGILRNTVYWIA